MGTTEKKKIDYSEINVSHIRRQMDCSRELSERQLHVRTVCVRVYTRMFDELLFRVQ